MIGRHVYSLFTTVEIKRTDTLGRSGAQVKSCMRLERLFGKTQSLQVVAGRPGKPGADHVAAVGPALFQEDDAVDIRSLAPRPSPPASVIILATDEY